MDTKVTFRIDAHLKEELHHMAICQHTTMNALIVQAISESLARYLEERCLVKKGLAH